MNRAKGSQVLCQNVPRTHGPCFPQCSDLPRFHQIGSLSSLTTLSGFSNLLLQLLPPSSHQSVLEMEELQGQVCHSINLTSQSFLITLSTWCNQEMTLLGLWLESITVGRLGGAGLWLLFDIWWPE